MKLYSHVVLNAFLISTLALPAFCQKEPTFPDAQAFALADQVAKLAEQADKMAAAFSDDRIAALNEQAAKIATQFDSEKIAEWQEKAFAAADKARDLDSK